MNIIFHRRHQKLFFSSLSCLSSQASLCCTIRCPGTSLSPGCLILSCLDLNFHPPRDSVSLFLSLTLSLSPPSATLSMHRGGPVAQVLSVWMLDVLQDPCPWYPTWPYPNLLWKRAPTTFFMGIKQYLHIIHFFPNSELPLILRCDCWFHNNVQYGGSLKLVTNYIYQRKPKRSKGARREQEENYNYVNSVCKSQ